jgi:hypothetical protein
MTLRRALRNGVIAGLRPTRASPRPLNLLTPPKVPRDPCGPALGHMGGFRTMSTLPEKSPGRRDLPPDLGAAEGQSHVILRHSAFCRLDQ